MVLSNKKLKQKLRAKFEQINASKNPTNLESETLKSLKHLLDSKTPTTRLSKREKRRESLNILPINGEKKDTLFVEEASKVKKRKREEKGDENGGGTKVEKKEKKGVENGGEIEGKKGEKLSERMIEKRRKRMERQMKKRELGDLEKGVKEGSDLKKKVKVQVKMMKKKKKKKKYKKKSKKVEVDKKENQVEVENGGLSHEVVAEMSEANDDDRKKVYVGGMPYSSTEDDIWNYFDQCGALADIDCLKFPDSGKFRGIAIISFKTEEAAEKALALDGSDMEGLYLKIQPYKTTRTPKPTNFSPPVIEGYNRIYAGNLSWDITENDLRKLFSDCNILSVRFGEDKETGEFKGYAHVDFSDSDSLTKALKLDQKVVCGRPVKISRAVPAKGPLRIPVSASTPAAVKPQENYSGAIDITPQENYSVIRTVTLQENTSGVSSGKLKRRTCYECGEKGHISSECRVKGAVKPQETSIGAIAVIPQENSSGITAVTPQEKSSGGITAVTPQENTSGVSSGKLKRRTCYECGEKGHISSECRVKAAVKPQDVSTGAATVAPQENSSAVMTVTSQENSSGVSSGKLKRRTCYECGEKGHISSACPKKQATTN